jgi:hypothetical protein
MNVTRPSLFTMAVVCICLASHGCGGSGASSGAMPTSGVPGDGGSGDGTASIAPPADGGSAIDASSSDASSANDQAAPPAGDSGAPPALAVCATLATLPTRTPSYFVDFGAGSDTADGKSQATAFKHAPGDANATGAAKATTLAPGDVVLLKGGVVYQGTITITASGTAQSPIVLEGGPQQHWGTGMAIVDGQDMRALGIGLQNASYVVVEGFEVRNFDKSQSSTGIDVQGGSSDQVVGNRLHDIYYATNPSPGTTTWEAQRGTGISVTNSPGSAVSANFVRDVGNAGIAISADAASVTGGSVQCNEVTNMNWGIAAVLGDSVAGTHLENVVIAHNYIHDFDQYEVCASWHRDGLFVFARPDDDTLTIDNLEIADNYFEDTLSKDFGSTAWIYIEYACKNFNIHHNILNASRSYYAIRILGDGFQVQGNHVIADNVIANANGNGSAGMHVMESSGAQIRGNIFYDDDVGYMIATDSMPGFAGDYNLFYRTTSGTNVAFLNAASAESPGSGGALQLGLSGMQAKGFETHGLYGDPLWSTPFASIASDASGFKPMTGSPAIDHGKMLGYTADYAGTPIPRGAGPDMGAFEQ